MMLGKVGYKLSPGWTTIYKLDAVCGMIMRGPRLDEEGWICVLFTGGKVVRLLSQAILMGLFNHGIYHRVITALRLRQVQ
jgi:hypothetical protein